MFWGSGNEDSYDILTESSPWDEVGLGGYTLYGRCTVRGSFSRKIDLKNAPGSDGGTLTDLGYEPARIDITLQLWTADHWQTWQQVASAIRPRPGKGVGSPLDITHPALSVYGIKSVYVVGMSLPIDSGTPGVKEVTISCIEWLPPRRTSANTPKSSKASPRPLDLSNVPTVASSPASTPGADQPLQSRPDQLYTPGV